MAVTNGPGHVVGKVGGRGSGADQRGQATTEIVLLLPLLLVVVFLIFEFGRVFGSWIIITNAAREGARLGVVLPFDPSSDSTIIQRVQTAASFLTVSASACPLSGAATSCITVSRCSSSSTCPASYNNTNNDDMLTVLVEYQVQTLTPINVTVPFVGNVGYPGTMTVAGQTIMRSEQ